MQEHSHHTAKGKPHHEKAAKHDAEDDECSEQDAGFNPNLYPFWNVFCCFLNFNKLLLSLNFFFTISSHLVNEDESDGEAKTGHLFENTNAKDVMEKEKKAKAQLHEVCYFSNVFVDFFWRFDDFQQHLKQKERIKKDQKEQQEREEQRKQKAKQKAAKVERKR